jgi:hypothetical protein
VLVDRAGIRFGEDVAKRRFSLKFLADGFAVAEFLPALDGLPDGISAQQLAAQFGDANDERLRRELLLVDERIRQLPIYRPVASPFNR